MSFITSLEQSNTYILFHLFLAHKVGRFPVHHFPLFLVWSRKHCLHKLPLKHFMQEFIHSMILSRFHVKDCSLLFSKKLIFFFFFGLSFLPFEWEIQKRIWKTVFTNSGLACARIISKKKTAVHENGFANPFSDFPIEW